MAPGWRIPLAELSFDERLSLHLLAAPGRIARRAARVDSRTFQVNGRALTVAALSVGVGMACSAWLDSGPISVVSAQDVTADRSESNEEWTHPVTPWGDPDLQGMWPIAHLIGTPMERPVQYGNRRFMTDEEFAEVLARVEQRNTRYDEEIRSNRMGGGHWAEPTEALRLTSLIVDPPDGRFPALTEAGAEKAKTMSGSYYQDENFDDLTDFDSWDRCITRGLPVSMLPRNYNNGIRIHQAPGYVVISLEMAHESRIVPLDGRAPLDPA